MNIRKKKELLKLIKQYKRSNGRRLIQSWDEKRNGSPDWQFGVVFSGGSIGEKTESYTYKGLKLVKFFETLEDAKDYSKRLNKSLSPGDKKFYHMKYSATKINPKNLAKH